MHFYTMEDVVLRSEVMRVIDEGDPFTLLFVTADRKRGTGGDLIEVRDWQKISKDTVVEALPGRQRKTVRAMIKDPNHWENKTINIHNPNNRALHPTKVHYRLIQFFNGKRVLNG